MSRLSPIYTHRRLAPLPSSPQDSAHAAPARRLSGAAERRAQSSDPAVARVAAINGVRHSRVRVRTRCPQPGAPDSRLSSAPPLKMGEQTYSTFEFSGCHGVSLWRIAFWEDDEFSGCCDGCFEVGFAVLAQAREEGFEVAIAAGAGEGGHEQAFAPIPLAYTAQTNAVWQDRSPRRVSTWKHRRQRKPCYHMSLFRSHSWIRTETFLQRYGPKEVPPCAQASHSPKSSGDDDPTVWQPGWTAVPPGSPTLHDFKIQVVARRAA